MDSTIQAIKRTRYGLEQVVDADRSLGGLCGFGIDALVIEITEIWRLDDILIA
jgi:hypothetical protein